MPAIVTTNENGSCPTAEMQMATRDRILAEVQSLLRGDNNTQPCPCAGSGPWRRIAHLNMSDPNEQCPPNWRLVNTFGRACGQSVAESCNSSAVFPSNGRAYSRVCVEESMLIQEDLLKLSLVVLMGVLLAWMVLTLTVSVSLMELQVQDSTFGHSQPISQQTSDTGWTLYVPALTALPTGLSKCLPM